MKKIMKEASKRERRGDKNKMGSSGVEGPIASSKKEKWKNLKPWYNDK